MDWVLLYYLKKWDFFVSSWGLICCYCLQVVKKSDFSSCSGFIRVEFPWTFFCVVKTKIKPEIYHQNSAVNRAI